MGYSGHGAAALQKEDGSARRFFDHPRSVIYIHGDWIVSTRFQPFPPQGCSLGTPRCTPAHAEALGPPRGS
jgi:hypothetical protein